LHNRQHAHHPTPTAEGKGERKEGKGKEMDVEGWERVGEEERQKGEKGEGEDDGRGMKERNGVGLLLLIYNLQFGSSPGFRIFFQFHCLFMTLNFEIDQRANYLDQSLFRSKVVVRT